MTTPADKPGVAAKPRMALPLSAKILAWLFVNLLLLAIVAAFVVHGQFRFGLDSLLTGRAGERLQALSEVVVAELNASPRSRWPAVVKRFADAYQIQMAVVRNDGSRVAGEISEVPPEVRGKLVQPLPRDLGRPGAPPPERRPDGPPGERPSVRNGPPENRPFNDPRDARPPDDRVGREGFPVPIMGGNPGSFPKLIQRVSGPFPYWIVIRAPIAERNAAQNRPLALLLAVPSLGTGGLLFDYKPWLWIGAGVLIFSVLLWFPLVRGITRSIKQMTGAAGEMARGQFGTRVDTDRRDELGRLGDSLNHMAGRLDEHLSGQKRFLGDIAHELCSPLARMEMALGILEQQCGDAQQGYVTDVREEVRHMSTLVNELLSFTKAGLRSKEIELRPVPLAEICGRAITREGAEKMGIVVDIDLHLAVMAEPELLARAIGNVIRNSIRYAGDAGPIVLSTEARGADVLLSIADNGPGVSPEALHRLLDPFFRPESARTREGGGAGLGLAIVKSCVEACGGSVAVKNCRSFLAQQIQLTGPAAADTVIVPNSPPRGLQVDITLRRATK